MRPLRCFPAEWETCPHGQGTVAQVIRTTAGVYVFMTLDYRHTRKCSYGSRLA